MLSWTIKLARHNYLETCFSMVKSGSKIVISHILLSCFVFIYVIMSDFGNIAFAQINVRPDSLKFYSYCIGNAKDRNRVFFLDRGTMYRCRDDVAVSYFNYLGRIRVQDKRVIEPTGVFIYRYINGVGKCWNMIEDQTGASTSIYGCDIYVEM